MAASIGVEIMEINGEADHIHFIIQCSPQDKLGSLIGALKAKSASWVHDNFIIRAYWSKHRRTLWSSGYFVCSVGGAPLTVLKQYIQNQGA